MTSVKQKLLEAVNTDLLEALEELVSFCNYMHEAEESTFHGDNRKEWLNEREPQSRNAIAKAKRA